MSALKRVLSFLAEPFSSRPAPIPRTTASPEAVNLGRNVRRALFRAQNRPTDSEHPGVRIAQERARQLNEERASNKAPE